MQNKPNRGKFFFFIISCALGAVFYTYYNQIPRELSISEKAEQRAMMIAQQLIESQFQVKNFVEEKKNTAEENRGLASESQVLSLTRKVLDGEVGRDPWGKPFGFQVKGDGKKGSIVYIWSVGENQKPDFKNIGDMIANGSNGDDILVVMPF